MTGRHVAPPRHRAPGRADDLPSLDELIRITGSTPRVDPMNPRPDLPPIPPQLADRAARWAQTPGGFDREVFG